ncbi:hypothetical protein CEXT_406971 [Caerostris extrusa]|uniref:Uncharacterized protein n=1 Tax=Caerostris extrusa TaxID=172846 RepID=A0AAV4XV42_CAEEX|nr:hypothetical protein CEXT_406971 [Caerostris extrusa]
MYRTLMIPILMRTLIRTRRLGKKTNGDFLFNHRVGFPNLSDFMQSNDPGMSWRLRQRTATTQTLSRSLGSVCRPDP